MIKNVPTSVSKSRATRLEKEWQELCACYLPLQPKDSIWRYHRSRSANEPGQGWKLHISATVLNATRVLKKVAPFLVERGVPFKAPSCLKEVIRLNSGSSEGYTQVGKIITVYPRTSPEAVHLAGHLHKLTFRMAAPTVPFDLRYRATSNVYYRFGAFQPLEIETDHGKRAPAVHGPHGKLIPDCREQPKPDWVTDPFAAQEERRNVETAQNPLMSAYSVLRVLAQRGKGGVYQALDFTVTPPRLCLIKEGRKHGELTWDGRDARWRVKNEERVLSELLAKGVDVPRVYSSFELEGNAYLVTEFIDGVTLQSLLGKLQRRMPISRVLKYGIQLAGFFSQMHAAGWVWRDCKPLNIVVTEQGILKPLDFEGASRVERPDSMLWGTPGFVPPEWFVPGKRTGLPDDLYALGSILYLLTTGSVPETTNPTAPEKLRRNIPEELCGLMMSLLSPEPRRRPSAREAVARLDWSMRGIPVSRRRQDIRNHRDIENSQTRSLKLAAVMAG
jgi:hypothetical protein